jgi:glutathione S-transferase
MLRLYQHPFSTYSRRVQIALLEKNIEAEQVLVDLPGREHKREPYLSLNPYARVPTLVDDDFVLYESTAILEYLEARHPQPALLPADIKGRALVAMHMKLCDLQMTRPAGLIVFSKRFVPEAAWRREEMAKAKKDVEKHFSILDRQLEHKQYLVGERYTLGDLCYVPHLHYLPLIEVEPPPNVRAWAQRLLARPSSVATTPVH